MMRFLINCIITISFILCFHLISEVYAEDDDPNIFNGVLFAACTSERGVDNVDEVKFALSKVNNNNVTHSNHLFDSFSTPFIQKSRLSQFTNCTYTLLL